VVFLKGVSSLHLGTHVSVRGVGVIDVAEIFGRDLILESRFLDLILDLKPVCATDGVEVLGIDEKSLEILGVRLPLVELPLTGQRPLATLVEVIAQNENLKKQNVFMAKKFAG
jgi:HPr kinase/phosphorylase